MHIISRQVHFSESSEELATAALIIAQKIKNQRGMLLSRLQNTKRAGYLPLQDAITSAAAQLQKIEESFSSDPRILSKNELFLKEARAAKIYWNVFGLLAGRPTWRRKPGAREDSVNMLLDVGYHLLFQKISEALKQSDLNAQVGLLHAESTPMPLVYDIAELWRQPIVDAALLAFLRKNPKKALGSENYIAKICADINRRWESRRVSYNGQCVRTEIVAYRECVALRKAITDGIPWRPKSYLWGRSSYCK